MPESATVAQLKPVQRASALLWVMFLGYFTFSMISNILGGIIPEIIKHPEVIGQQQLSLFTAGLLAFAFFLAYGLCSIPAGLLMDRFGAKPLVIVGVALMGSGCLLVSRAHSYPLMLAMVFAVGVGVTVLQTAGNPLVQHLDKPENYHRNLTLTIGFCGIGAFLGPFLLAYIRGSGRPWQTLYIVFAALCLLLLALLAISPFPVLSTQSSSRFRFDQLANLVKNPTVLAYALALFFYVGAEVGTASYIVNFFERVHHITGDSARLNLGGLGLSPTLTSFLTGVLPTLPLLIVALFWGAQGVGRFASGAFLNRLGSRRILRAYALMALVSVGVANLGTEKVTAVAFVACGFFTSVLFTLLFSGSINTFPDNPGTLSGLLCTAIVGGAFLPPLVGLVGDRANMHAAMLVPAAAFAYIFGLSLFGRAKYE